MTLQLHDIYTDPVVQPHPDPWTFIRYKQLDDYTFKVVVIVKGGTQWVIVDGDESGTVLNAVLSDTIPSHYREVIVDEAILGWVKGHQS